MNRHISQDEIWAIPKTAEQAKAGFKLLDSNGNEITLPARMTCWDGAEVIVCDFKPSRFDGNEGYIYTTFNETLRPSVVGAKIVAVSHV